MITEEDDYWLVYQKSIIRSGGDVEVEELEFSRSLLKSS